MKTKFRKILSLVLSLTLICALATAAFATSPPYNVEEDYDDGRYLVQASAAITRYGANGQIYIEDNETGKPVTGTLRYVSMEYRYITVNSEANDSDVITKTITTSTTTDHAATARFNDTSIHSMLDAKFTFKADVPASYGTQHFTPNPVTLIY